MKFIYEERNEAKLGLRKEKAIELHKNRYTCSQAVACAFCDLVDVDELTMKDMVRRYSGGAYKVCGAVMGAYVIVNYLNGNINPDNPAEPIKEDLSLLKEIEKKFKEKNSSVICRELKGLEAAKVLPSSRRCVEVAAEILEELISKENNYI